MEHEVQRTRLLSFVGDYDVEMSVAYKAQYMWKRLFANTAFIHLQEGADKTAMIYKAVIARGRKAESQELLVEDPVTCSVGDLLIHVGRQCKHHGKRIHGLLAGGEDVVAWNHSDWQFFRKKKSDLRNDQMFLLMMGDFLNHRLPSSHNYRSPDIYVYTKISLDRAVANRKSVTCQSVPTREVEKMEERLVSMNKIAIEAGEKCHILEIGDDLRVEGLTGLFQETLIQIGFK